MKKYLIGVLTFLIMITAVGCGSKNEDKKLVRDFLVDVYEISEIQDGVYESRSKLFPNDEITNNMKELFSTDGFEDYKIDRTGLKILSTASDLMATTKLEDIVIEKYGDNTGEDTCYEYKAKLRFDYMYGDDTFTREVNGQVTVGKENDSEKVLIKKLNKLSEPEDTKFSDSDEVIGVWKVENVDKLREPADLDNLNEILKMQWTFGKDMVTMKNGESRLSLGLKYVLLEKNRIDIFIDNGEESRHMYEYSVEGDRLLINKYKEVGTVIFRRVDE